MSLATIGNRTAANPSVLRSICKRRVEVRLVSVCLLASPPHVSDTCCHLSCCPGESAPRIVPNRTEGCPHPLHPTQQQVCFKSSHCRLLPSCFRFPHCHLSFKQPKALDKRVDMQGRRLFLSHNVLAPVGAHLCVSGTVTAGA